jgi:tetratricopeptide (TPR) repeat protein
MQSQPPAGTLYDQGVAEACNNRGFVLEGLGRLKDALASYEEAISLSPNFALAYNSRGRVLRSLERFGESLASLDTAIALDPNLARAHCNRGLALNDLKRHQEALASLDAAIALDPNLWQAHNGRGTVFRELKRFEDALASADAAIALDPSLAPPHNLKGSVLRDLERYRDALASLDTAIALDPALAIAHLNRGIVLTLASRHEDALASYDAATALEPDLAMAHWNKGLYLLSIGQFLRGWRLYEWRHKLAGRARQARRFDRPLWLGDQSLRQRTILLHCEQGYGDTLQFCRYAQIVKSLGARVILEVPAPLLALLGGLAGVDHAVAEGAELPDFDYHCPLMSLPLAFKTELTTIPRVIPYIFADPQKSTHWRARLGEGRRPRVGLVWNGGFRPDQPEVWAVNEKRNISFQQIAGLNLPDVDFFSLQKGEPSESELQKQKPLYWAEHNFYNLTAELNDFSDTAALVDNLDLVISVDTSTAHLAGAMGKPVWILNRFDSCWRWLHGRSDSPWYPSARLYQQPRAGDWASVIEEGRRDLADWASKTGASPSPL